MSLKLTCRITFSTGNFKIFIKMFLNEFSRGDLRCMFELSCRYFRCYDGESFHPPKRVPVRVQGLRKVRAPSDARSSSCRETSERAPRSLAFPLRRCVCYGFSRIDTRATSPAKNNCHLRTAPAPAPAPAPATPNAHVS